MTKDKRFGKKTLEKFICQRKRTMGSLTRHFGYQPKMSKYLNSLIKQKKISSSSEFRKFGGNQLVFTKYVNSK